MKEYKVLTQKDKWFSGKFDPVKLEEALNAYAKQGWKVVSAFSADIPGFLAGAREEAIIILERDAQWMAYKSLYKGIIFIEGQEDYIKNLGKVAYKKDSFYNNQLKNLDNVKEQLADKAIQAGGNAIINFKYGQKNTSWFRSMLLAFDDNVNWFGEGEIVILEENKYKDFIEKIKNS